MTAPVESPPAALRRLENAYRDVLLDAFEDQIHALTDSTVWYRESLPVSELFRFWVQDRYADTEDSAWVFEPIRSGERVLLCNALGIDRAKLVGQTPRGVANLVLLAAGLPLMDVAHLGKELRAWQDARSLVDNGEDERASVVLRMLSERLLKRTLHYHCATGFASEFLAILRNPGSLRLPTRLGRVAADPSPAAEERLLALFADEGWADLGFLIIALRKLADRLEGANTQTICGEPLALFSKSDAEAFQSLAAALQAYVHDKPSALEARRVDLTDAARNAEAAAIGMITRRVVPEEALVVQRAQSIFGPIFHGYSGGKVRVISCDSLPPLGQRVMFTLSAERDYGFGLWTHSLPGV